MGTPMSRAYQAARMLPKLPVGTQTSMGSPPVDRAARGEVGVPAHVVDDLREQAAPVDRVGRAQGEPVPLGQLRGEVAVVEHRLDRALAVVEVAAEAEHGEVVARLRDHLQLLQGGDAGVRVVDADPGVGAIGEAVERRHAGVAAGRDQDEEVQVGRALGVRLLQRLAEVERHALQGHVLERQRGAVPELEHVAAPAPPRGPGRPRDRRSWGRRPAPRSRASWRRRRPGRRPRIPPPRARGTARPRARRSAPL